MAARETAGAPEFYFFERLPLPRAELRPVLPFRAVPLFRVEELARLAALLRAAPVRELPWLEADLLAAPARDRVLLALLLPAPLLLAVRPLPAAFVVPLFFVPALLRVGRLLRLALAILWSSLSLIESAIWREAPFRPDLDRSPRLAERAAPAAFCCCLDLAGIVHHSRQQCRYVNNARCGITLPSGEPKLSPRRRICQSSAGR